MKILPPLKAIALFLMLCFFSSPYLLAGPKPFLWREKNNSEKPAADIEENGRRLSSRDDTDEDSNDSDINTSANMSRSSGMDSVAEQPQKEKVVDSAEMPPQLFTPEELNLRVLRMQENILKWQQARDRVVGSHIQEQIELLNQAKIELEAYKMLQEAYASVIETTYFADPEVREKIPALMASFQQVLEELENTKIHLDKITTAREFKLPTYQNTTVSCLPTLEMDRTIATTNSERMTNTDSRQEDLLRIAMEMAQRAASNVSRQEEMRRIESLNKPIDPWTVFRIFYRHFPRFF